MTERAFDDGFWTDRFVIKLPLEAKALFAYLKTNTHCNQAGLYQITLETIAFETKIPQKHLPELLDMLKSMVVWYPDEDLIWYKDFIKQQTKSPKFLQAAAKCLTAISNNGAVKDLLDYNTEKYSISIPYQYYMDTIQIPSSLSWSKTKSKGRGEGEEQTPKKKVKGVDIG